MQIKAGLYSAAGQPDIIVIYDGHLHQQVSIPPDVRGPWIQWRFPWDAESQYQTNLIFDFEAMLAAGGYTLKEERTSEEMRFDETRL
jgi:hypothetical protein